MKYQFGFIGCGNMGGALVGAAAKSVEPCRIAVCDHNAQKTEALVKKFGVQKEEIATVAAESKFVVLGVKPQGMEKTLAEIKEVLQERKDVVLITMAAGLSAEVIAKMAGGAFSVIRMMPNTPCLHGEGLILYACLRVGEAEKKEFVSAFQAAGRLDELDEKDIDGAGALSGCGPAFVYAFADALAAGAAELGIPSEKAVEYAAQTCLGAAKMMLETGKTPSTLCREVCSPGGTTLAGIAALKEGNFENVTKSAVLAAYKRTLELKK